LYQGSTKTHIFHFFGFYPVRSDVVNPIVGPDQFMDFHALIIHKSVLSDKHALFSTTGPSRTPIRRAASALTFELWQLRASATTFDANAPPQAQPVSIKHRYLLNILG